MCKSKLNEDIEHVKLFKCKIIKSGSKHDMTGIFLLSYLNLKYLSQVETRKDRNILVKLFKF